MIGRVDISDCTAKYKPAILEHKLDLFNFKPGGAIGVCHRIRTIKHAPACSALRPENSAKTKMIAEHLGGNCSAWRLLPVVVVKPDGTSERSTSSPFQTATLCRTSRKSSDIWERLNGLQ